MDNPAAWERRQTAQYAVPSCARRSERAYIDAAGIDEDRKGWLFRTVRGHNGSTLSDKPMSQPDAWRMTRRRAAAAGIAAPIGCHTFRTTGITAYLANGGALEPVQEIGPREPIHDQALRPYEGETHRGRGGEDQAVSTKNGAPPRRPLAHDAGWHEAKELAMNLMWWSEHPSELPLLLLTAGSYPFIDVVLPDPDALWPRPSAAGRDILPKSHPLSSRPLFEGSLGIASIHQKTLVMATTRDSF